MSGKTLRILQLAFFLAVKDISKDRKILALVLLALTVGSMSTVFSTAVMDSFMALFTDQVTGTLLSDIVVEPRKGEDYIRGVLSKVKILRSFEGVAGVSARLESGVILTYGDESKSVALVGYYPPDEKEVSVIQQRIDLGEAFGDYDTSSILMGKLLADELDIKLNDKLTITFRNGMARDYRVKGIVLTQLAFVDMTTVYINSFEVARVLDINDRATSILVKLKDREHLDDIKRELSELLLWEKVSTWKEKLGFFESILVSLQVVWETIRSVGFLTTTLTIAIIIYVNTSTKKRQIGILKAVGAKNRIVLKIYLLEALIFGALGLTLGAGASAILFTLLAELMLSTPIGPLRLAPSFRGFIVTGLGLIGLSVVGALIPAWRASKMDMVKAIWSV